MKRFLVKIDWKKALIIVLIMTVAFVLYPSQEQIEAAWDIGSASYDTITASIVNEEASVYSISFSSDGTKMYVDGVGGTKKVYQYSLSTAWDVSTASYSSLFFSLSGQITSPGGHYFKSDGTKMFVVDYAGDVVYQYSLSTAWNVSTASYDNKSFSVAQDTDPKGLFFNSDGTKMYVTGNANDTVYQYSLSTAWDVSTVSYDTVSLNVSGQDLSPKGLYFKSDGTKIYIAGDSGNAIYQYSLTTAWDLSTASYDGVSLAVGTEDVSPKGIYMKSDGTKIYMGGSSGDKVYQYSISSTVTFTQSAYRLFNNANSTDVGSALAAQDTAGTLAATGDAFRLRSLVHIATSNLATSTQTFKLQYAAKSGTCDTSFTGETYADVTTGTVIAYNNNATPADAATLTTNVNDPTHGADTVVTQTYEELNDFINTKGAITSGQDGIWDFSLIDNGATEGTSYCLRVVKSDGTTLDTYSVIPEVITHDLTPAYVDVGTDSVTCTTDTITPGYPSTVNANDILILIVFHTNNDTFNTPTGWTHVADKSSPTSDKRAAWFWKRATGSETGTVTVTRTQVATNRFYGVIARFSGVKTTSQPYSSYGSWSENATTTYRSSALTTTGDNRLVVALVAEADNRTNQGLSNFTKQVEVKDTSCSPGISIDLETQAIPITAVVPAESGTIGTNAEDQISFTFDLLPVGGAAQSAPSITSVFAGPNPVNVGDDVSFNVAWSDSNGSDLQKAFICKTNAITTSTPVCTGTTWASSSSATGTSPIVVSYTVLVGDVGSNNYYAFVCDDSGDSALACSNSTVKTFSVYQSTNRGNVKGGFNIKGGTYFK